MSSSVKVILGQDPCKAAYDAMASVFRHDAKGKRVLLKPNIGFEGPAKSGLCTHPEVIRGLIQFFKDREAVKIIVGDSSVIGVDSIGALMSSGIYDVCQEEGVQCMDLNTSSPIRKEIRQGHMIDDILLSSILYEVDLVVSVPVMKTHMYTGVSLSIKNMKGGMYRREKNKLHRLKKSPPEGSTARALDYGILDLTTVLYPDYAVIDGTVGMEGFGPSGGTPKPFGVVLASAEPVAADMIALRLMGMDMADAGHIMLVSNERGISYDDISVDPQNYTDYINPFVTPKDAKLNLKADNIELVDESACSGCHAALTQFLRYHSKELAQEEKFTLFAGKDITPEQLEGKRAFLVGNCTAKFRERDPFCKGCPPVTSEILKMVKGEDGVKIQFLGHSAFMVSTKFYKILFDPFLSNNPRAALKASEVKATHLCVTHGHDDHFGDTLEIARKNKATVYSTFGLAKALLKDVDTISGNIGGKIKTEFGSVKFVAAVHESGVVGSTACGILAEVEDMKIYHAGDTALTMDMALLEDEGIDVALLPIGGTYTMDSDDALKAVKLIKPKYVIPMHYNTFLEIEQNPENFRQKVEKATSTKVIVLEPGASFQL